jgi:hypothetical protein
MNPSRSVTARATSSAVSRRSLAATRSCATRRIAVRGYYDAKGDFTRDASENIVAKGNKLRSMIC